MFLDPYVMSQYYIAGVALATRGSGVALDLCPSLNVP